MKDPNAENYKDVEFLATPCIFTRPCGCFDWWDVHKRMARCFKKVLEPWGLPSFASGTPETTAGRSPCLLKDERSRGERGLLSHLSWGPHMSMKPLQVTQPQPSLSELPHVTPKELWVIAVNCLKPPHSEAARYRVKSSGLIHTYLQGPKYILLGNLAQKDTFLVCVAGNSSLVVSSGQGGIMWMAGWRLGAKQSKGRPFWQWAWCLDHSDSERNA